MGAHETIVVGEEEWNEPALAQQAVVPQYDVMLTTVDNPYNPFEEFDKWWVYDNEKGYDTCGLAARLTHTSTEFGEAKQLADAEKAFDEFIALDPLQLYKKVTKPL